MKTLLWFLRQEFLSHPSPPLYSSPPLSAAEIQQQHQRASLVTPTPGYQLHLQVETEQSKTSCQLCQEILPSSQFGPSASLCYISASQLFLWQCVECLLRQRHFASHVSSLHGRQRNSRAAFLGSTEQLNTTDSQDRQKTTASLCLGQTLPLLVSACWHFPRWQKDF